MADLAAGSCADRAVVHVLQAGGVLFEPQVGDEQGGEGAGLVGQVLEDLGRGNHGGALHMNNRIYGYPYVLFRLDNGIKRVQAYRN